MVSQYPGFIIERIIKRNAAAKRSLKVDVDDDESDVFVAGCHVFSIEMTSGRGFMRANFGKKLNLALTMHTFIYN